MMYASDVEEAVSAVARCVRSGGGGAFQEVDVSFGFGYGQSVSMPLLNKILKLAADAYQQAGVHAAAGVGPPPSIRSGWSRRASNVGVRPHGRSRRLGRFPLRG